MSGRKRELTLSVEAEGRTFDFENEVLVLEDKQKPAIKLHFLRYGELLNAPEKSHLGAKVKTENSQPQKDEQGNLVLEEVIITDPKLENFSTVKTGLNAGYVYIIDESKTGEYIEFEVDENGNFSSVNWEKGGEFFPDIREVDGKVKNNGFYEAEFDATVWAAYAHVQWSKDYYDALVNDAAMRAERMTKVKASGFPLGFIEAQGDSYPYTAVNTYFSADQNSLCKQMQGKIDAVKNQEERRDRIRKENPDHSEPDILTDMFVVLEDPIGNANEITNGLSYEIIKHRANVEAMQTATNPDGILKRMLSKGAPGRLNGEKEQINAMFNLALTTYQLVYNSEDMIDDYDGGKIGWGRGIYKPKLLAVLGVEERKKQRAKINSFRDDLGTFLGTNTYKEAYKDHEESTDFCVMDGKWNIMQHLRVLAVNPHDIDRTFDLRDDYEKSTKWDDFLESSLKEGENDSFQTVLNKEIVFDEDMLKQGVDIANKMADFAIASLETYAKYALEDVVKVESYVELKKVPVEGRYKLTLDRMNTVKLKTKGPKGSPVTLYEVRNYEIVDKLEAKNMKLNRSKNIFGFYSGKKDYVRFKTNTPEIVLLESSRGKHIFDVPVIEEVEREIMQYRNVTTKQPTKLASRVGAFVNGTPFRGVVALLQIVNVTAAYDSVSDEINIKNRSTENIMKARVALAGVSSELVAATGYFSKSVLSKTASETTLKFIGKWALRAEIAGNGITVIICGWEAIQSYGRRDHDAMWAWIGAAAAFSVTTAVAMSGTVAALLGPIGWIAAGIGVGLVILAYYLKDSPLEAYFKHFTFSDHKALDKYQNELTWAYNKRFYNSRKILIGDDDNEYLKYTDFKLAAAELTDLIVCADITLNPIKVIHQKEEYIPSYSRHSVGTTIKEGDIQEFMAMISFRQFFNTPDQLHYQVFYYQDGIFKGNAEELEICEPVTREEGTREKPPVAKVNFKIPESFLENDNKNSQVLFIAYLDIGENKFYPTRYQNYERYVGVLASINQLKTETIGKVGVYNRNHTYHSNVRINTLNNLKSGNAWKK